MQGPGIADTGRVRGRRLPPASRSAWYQVLSAGPAVNLLSYEQKTILALLTDKPFL